MLRCKALSVSVMALFSIAAIALIAPLSAAAASDHPQVLVVNSPSQPVPVTGSLTVTNTPSVTIANTPLPVSGTIGVTASSPLPVTGTVGISGQISLSTSSPLAVTNPLNSGNPVPLAVTPGSLQAYQSSCIPGLSLECAFAAVPAGKLLVVQEFDFDSQAASGSFTSVQVLTQIGGGGIVYHNFTVTSMGSHQATHQATTLYQDTTGGGAPVCSVNIGGSASNIVCNISGYLVNAS